jgi:hypothetical protein
MVAQQVPDRGVSEFRLDLPCTAEHADERLVDQPHVLGVLAPATAAFGIGWRDEFRELVDRRVRNDGFESLKLLMSSYSAVLEAHGLHTALTNDVGPRPINRGMPGGHSLRVLIFRPEALYRHTRGEPPPSFVIANRFEADH